MSYLTLVKSAAPNTPAADKGTMFFDTNSELIYYKNDLGRCFGQSTNSSVANLAPAAATDTYLTDSDLLIPSFGFQIRTVFRWRISVSKTAASTATPVFTIRTGSARTTADTSRLVLTGPAQTAAADVGVYDIMLVVRSIGAAGVIQGTLSISHNGAAA